MATSIRFYVKQSKDIEEFAEIVEEAMEGNLYPGINNFFSNFNNSAYQPVYPAITLGRQNEINLNDEGIQVFIKQVQDLSKMVYYLKVEVNEFKTRT